MAAISSSLIRHSYTPFISSVVHHCSSKFRSLSIAACRNQNREKLWREFQQPSKHLLKALDAVKHLSSLSPSLTSADKLHLSSSITSVDKLHLTPDQAIGKVAAVYSNLMRVVVELNKSENLKRVELLCVVRGLLKNIEKKVLVGDKVLVGSIDWIDRRGRIDNVFDRKTELHQPAVANIDHLLVLFSLDQPKLEAFLLTRFLVEAESTGIPVTVALNKSELVDKETIMSWKSKLCSWGYEPIFCSVVTKAGLGPLYAKLRDRTSVIMGPSGVGKSSVINALRSNQFFLPPTNSNLGSKWLEGQRVGEVSAKSGNGKHTTCNVSLLPLFGGGYVADTPGFTKKLELLKVTQQSLATCFPEVRNILCASDPLKCAYGSNCLHIGEPGCVVKTDWERHFYYFMLLDLIKIRDENPGSMREGDVSAKWKWKIEIRARYEAGDMSMMQLSPKKYRRPSRKKKMNPSFLDDVKKQLDDGVDESFFRR